MKRLNLFSFLAFAATISLGSCTDALITSSSETVDLLTKATISGYVTAEMNLQNSGLEFVPAGTKLLVEVNYADINSASTGKWKDTIEVSDDGKYSVAVPTDANGVTATITPFAFEADQSQAFGALNAKVKKAYSVVLPVSVGISAGQSVAKNIAFAVADLPGFTEKVKVSGKFQANLNQETGGLELVPNGTVINFYTTTWKDSAVITNGLYSILIPKSITVNWKSKFNFSKRVWSLEKATYTNVNYEFKLNGLGSFAALTEDFNFDAAEGTSLVIAPLTVPIVCTAVAELDESITGNENIPNAKVFQFFTTTNPIWGVSTSVSSGKFSFNPPINQTIYYTTKFTASKKVGMTDPETFSTVYVNEDYEYTISNGSKVLTDTATTMLVNAGTGVSVNPTLTISGGALAELDETVVGLESIPNNTNIKFYYPNSSGTSINVFVSNGKYTLTNVPKGRTVKYTGTFNANKKLANGSTALKTYTIMGSFTADVTKTVDIYAPSN